MSAFWDLDSERSVGGGIIGRIPWSAARRYAVEELKLGEDMLDPFWWMICSLDGAYREHMAAEFKRASKR